MARVALLRLSVVHAIVLAIALIVLAAIGGLDGTTAAVTAAALGGAFLASGALLLATLRPLSRVAEASRRVAAGGLDQRVEVDRLSGVAELPAAFNDMVRNLEEVVAGSAQERRRLLAVLNSSTDAVMAVGPDGRVAFANAAAERVFERREERIVGQPLGWLLADEQVLEAVRASREERRDSAIIVERPGRRYLRVITTPIAGGGDWASLVVCHDFTDVKRSEQVRRDFVANVSHELRTPVAALKSVIETLTGGALDDPEAARGFVERADAEVDRLALMIEELLDLSRLESGGLALTREPVDLSAVLAAAVEQVRERAEHHGLRLELDAPGLPPVTGDARRLERAVVNLVQNAIEFTPAGGSVCVSAGATDGAVRVAVRDSGVGIAPKDLPRVFERFYKADRARHGKGTGLGLAIVKHTVEAHGGTIDVASEEGRGTTFTFELPVGGRASSER